MADFSTLARPYAKAAFELARDSNRFAEWGKTLSALAAAVKMPEVSGFIGHPALFKGDLADVLSKALGDTLGTEGTALLKLLVENNRLMVAPAIAEQFEALRAEAESRIDVEITSATEIPPRQKEQLADAIGKRLSRDVVVSWKTDESLLAGAVIRAGDLVIDGSVAGELEKLSTALTT
ncbi:MAG TPA: F0F1 ATP synthase subunit delta [Nevskiaceae bacterium]|nr:F0F1 ATP synthase subunit delta [Nevskiaceae bacterium]